MIHQRLCRIEMNQQARTRFGLHLNIFDHAALITNFHLMYDVITKHCTRIDSKIVDF
jgi:hypothetical protein